MAECATGQGLHLTRFEGPTQCLWAMFPFFCLRMKKEGQSAKAPVPVGISSRVPGPRLVPKRAAQTASTPTHPSSQTGAGDHPKSLSSTHQVD